MDGCALWGHHPQLPRSIVPGRRPAYPDSPFAGKTVYSANRLGATVHFEDGLPIDDPGVEGWDEEAADRRARGSGGRPCR
jgi:hypothetical protein